MKIRAKNGRVIVSAAIIWAVFLAAILLLAVSGGCGAGPEHVCTFEVLGEIEGIETEYNAWTGGVYTFELTNGMVVMSSESSVQGYPRIGATLYQRMCWENRQNW